MTAVDLCIYRTPGIASNLQALGGVVYGHLGIKADHAGRCMCCWWVVSSTRRQGVVLVLVASPGIGLLFFKLRTVGSSMKERGIYGSRHFHKVEFSYKVVARMNQIVEEMCGETGAERYEKSDTSLAVSGGIPTLYHLCSSSWELAARLCGQYGACLDTTFSPRTIKLWAFLKDLLRSDWTLKYLLKAFTWRFCLAHLGSEGKKHWGVAML